MMLSAVFFVGFSTLAFEVLLTRVFSIGQWNHLSFMVISIALFGFAASGTFLSILDARLASWQQYLSTRRSTAIIIVLYSVTSVGSFMVLNNMPLDYFRLPLEPLQSLYLLIAFILLALPFFFSGFIVSVTYALLPEKTGLIYFASMCGSALGAIFPAPLLPVLGEGRLVIFSAVIPLILLPIILWYPPRKPLASQGPQATKIALLFLGFAIIFGSIHLMRDPGGALVQVKPSAYKALSQILQFPNTRIAETLHNIRGRTDRIISPHIRFVPGLSLRYMQTMVPQDAAFKDGDNQLVWYHFNSAVNTRFATFTLSYSGYFLRPDAQSALLVLQGGGSAIACALASKIRDITIVLENPSLAKMLQNHYRLPVTAQPPRAFLSQTSKHFDIIQVENWATSIPGSAALNQEHLFTTNAFVQYLRHLKPEGLIIISRKLLLPPADSLRLWATAYEGLKQAGAENPETHLAVLRNWDTFTLLVSKRPLADTARLEEFARARNFDLVYFSGIRPDQVNRFNQFDAPYHFIEISRLAAAYQQAAENAYFRSYFLDIAPQSDNRPFPGRFLKWPKIKLLYRSLGSRVYALLMSGEIVVAVVFIEALAVSGFLLMLPLFFVRRSGQTSFISHALYFTGVGAGFMFSELFFIKKYILLFGDPVISFTVVVAGILIFSSFGAAWVHKKDKHVLQVALIGLIVGLLLVFLVLDRFIEFLLRFAGIWHYAGALLVLFPIGFLMGLPFPLAMRDMLKTANQRAYAWSVNGCASVLTSIVAAQIALSFGISFILGAAIAAYVVVFFSWQHLDMPA